MKIIIGLFVLMLSVVSCDSLPEEITRQENDGSVKISFYTDIVEKELSAYMTGFNMSYYHDKDVLWADGKLANGLKEVRTKLLRYPGGAETSYFHWQYPGCPGYVDAWNPSFGVDLDAISQITENMDTDEFIALCNEIGAEPLLGINILSGVVNDKLDASLQEAKDWVTYCKDKGYKVKYWYLDNEVDHSTSYTQITTEEYAQIINLFSKELKAIDPNMKLIISMLGNATQDKYKKIVSLAGSSFDIIDLHYYYGWDVAEWNKWVAQRPMVNIDTNMSYTDEVGSLASYIKSSDNPDIELVCLEWNIAPSKAGIISDYKQALMQTEMFQQFLKSDLKMACVWPLIWNVEEGTFPSIFDQSDYTPTPLYRILNLYSEVLGHEQTFSISSDLRIVPQCVVGDKTSWICAINKSKYELPVKIEINGSRNYSNAKIHIIDSEDIDGNQCKASEKEAIVKNGMVEFTVPAFSFFRIDLN